MATDAYHKIFGHRADPPSAPLGGTLGILAIAFGVGVLGAYALDLHGHTCEACGRRWRHLGAFNLGDLGAHTCSGCGTVQWWKSGFQPGAAVDGAFRPPCPMSGAATAPRALAPSAWAASKETSWR